MSLSLEFEREMLQAMLEEDCLVITSKGLSLERVIVEFLRTYNSSASLVLIIGASDQEITYYLDNLTQEVPSGEDQPLAKSITYDTPINERVKLYCGGGVLFVTSRILVVDLLLDRVPLDLTTGMVVFKAHKIVDECQEAFIMRLYRMKNKTGFIKAFSNLPNAFTLGFGKIERIMRWLFVRKLQLWPRFHISVNTSLDIRAKPEVIEIRLQFSEYMRNVQFALMELISMELREIAKVNAALVDADEITVENAISPGFDNYLRSQFEPVWHLLSQRTKKMIDDLKLHRSLLYSLTDDDCITFYKIIKSIRDSVRIDARMSEWLFWEPTEPLYVNSKERVIDFVENKEKSPELNAKWINFVDIIKEIKEETKRNQNVTNVIVIVDDERTIEKLQKVHEMGAKEVLWDLWEKSKQFLNNILLEIEKQKSDKEKGPQPKKRRTLEPDPNAITLTQLMRPYEEKQEIPESSPFLLHYHCLSEGHLILDNLIRTYKPWYFIMYDPDMETIRQIEIYQASKCSPDRCRVYFFLYDGSFEEQKYLTSLRKEKEAFESLIKAKASMVIPENRDGKSGDNPDLIRQGAEVEVSSRQAGQQLLTRQDVLKSLIIVDMREFRSSLPSLIHKRGIDIEPVTIEIGDYILTPDICVERKSINDLIQSIYSGRLYNQCTAMIRHYKTSIILIEFDQNKSFSLRGRYHFGSHLIASKEVADLMRKLILLTIHFPQIRLIWSPSPYFSAEVFEYLKHDKEQPTADKAIAISEKQLPTDHYMDKYDISCKNLLLTLPGVNLSNVYAIMNKVKCFVDLVKLTRDELKKVLNNSEENSKALYDCLHSSLTAGSSGGNSSSNNANDNNQGGVIRPRGVFRKIHRFRRPGKSGKSGKKG